MNLPFETIESAQFAARLSIASDLDTFLQIAKSQDEVKQLVAGATDAELMSRILEILDRDFDSEFRNPGDTALAIYLWHLSDCNGSSATNVANQVQHDRSSWWWAAKVANAILGSDVGEAFAATDQQHHDADPS